MQPKLYYRVLTFDPLFAVRVRSARGVLPVRLVDGGDDAGQTAVGQVAPGTIHK